MDKGSVAVVGCGWLGLPLAQALLLQGYRVYGTTTTASKLPELQRQGIHASLLQLPLVDFPSSAFAKHDLSDAPASSSEAELWSAQQLVLTLPPRGARKLAAAIERGEVAASEFNSVASSYTGAILSAVMAYRRQQAAGRIIMCSSIGVYGRDHGLALAEDTLPAIPNPVLRQAMLLLAESLVQTQSQRPHRILRLGGLYGGDRDPRQWFAGRAIPRPDDPINLVSRERVIDKIVALLNQPFWSGPAVQNVVDVEHPRRGDFYGGG